jgi:RimJ/RimL family protein N-acetyltransferase
VLPPEIWPFFDLAVRTPLLELRYADDELATTMAGLAAQGVHDPATMPFFFPWTDVEPVQQRRNTLQYHWRMRAELCPERWEMAFAVLVDDEVVGCAGVHAAEPYPVTRRAETGSWLGLDAQGRGLGTELRRAALHLLFSGFGARVATTGAFADNERSLRVTRRLGYEANGSETVARRGEAATLLRFRMSEPDWRDRLRRDDVEIVGLEPCLEVLGLVASGSEDLSGSVG